MESKKATGIAILILGIFVAANYFVIAGTLFIIVGVSMIMDVNIWRR
jgi:hypothetical protein